MLYFRSFFLAVLAATLPSGLSAANAAEDTAVLTIEKATIGFGGKFKAGFWQPLRLTVVAGPKGVNGRLEVVVPDGDQMPVVYRDASHGALSLAAGEQKSVLLYFKSGPVAAPISVRLATGGGIAWSRGLQVTGTALSSTHELVVGLGPAMGLAEAASSIRRRAGESVQAVRIDAPAELPDRWWAYEGIDTLVLGTSDAKFLADMTDDQRQAIVQWVLLGGRIVFCVGSRGAEVAAPEGPWSQLIPGEFVEVDALRERSGLEIFTRTELPFDEPFFQRNRPYVTRLKNVRGEVLLDEVSSAAGRPLAIHAAAGLGLVTFVAIDVDHPSLKDWKGRTRLLAAILQHGTREREQSDRETRSGIKQLGYDDLVGQLRTALDQFPGVSLVNFTTVSVLTIVYLLLIGPGDFLLLSRLGLPRQVTWFTFPAVAFGICAVAGMMDRRVHGNSVRLNQVEIVDIDLATQTARGTVWAHLYSPATRPYDANLDLSLPPGVVNSSAEGWIAWQGLPGDSLGGLESRQPVLIRREPYSIALPGTEPQVDGLAVQVASSKSLSAGWWSKTALPLDSKLTIDRFGLLTGEFRLPVDVALAECVLAHGEKLYRVGTLEPGARVRMADYPPLDLEARLTQRRIEQSKDVSTPWEQDSVDVPRIAQMLMFHDAARGRSYTGLTHRYQPRLDLSQHVHLGQAVLAGRSSKPVARLQNGEAALVEPENANNWTWYRIILPVGARTLNPEP